MTTTRSTAPPVAQWSQRGARVFLHLGAFTFHFDAPPGYRIDDTAGDLRALALHILFAKTRWAAAFPAPSEPTAHASRRTAHDRIALAYSNGVDSGAALLLLPAARTVPIFLARAFHDGSALAALRSRSLRTRWRLALVNDVNAQHGVRTVRKRGIADPLVVPSDFELIAPLLDPACGIGYRWGNGYSALLVLLADFLGARHIANGAILEGLFLRETYRFVDILRPSSAVRRWQRTFRAHGLELAYPVGGLSEVTTARLVARSALRDICSSCDLPARRGTTACGHCAKCYRKARVCGESAPRNAAAYLARLTPPFAPATTTRYADGAPNLECLTRAYGPYLTHPDPLTAPPLAARLRHALTAHDINPMTDADITRLRAFGDEIDALRATTRAPRVRIALCRAAHRAVVTATMIRRDREQVARTESIDAHRAVMAQRSTDRP